MLDPAAAQIRARQPIIDGVRLGDGCHALRPIHKNSVPGQQSLGFIEINPPLFAELAAFLDPAWRQIARKTADASVTGGKPRSGQRFTEIVDLFSFSERVQEDG